MSKPTDLGLFKITQMSVTDTQWWCKCVTF